MRLLKLGLFSIVILFLLVTVISLLIPSEVRLSRATNLPNERKRIFSILQNERMWHPAWQDTASAKVMTELKRSTITQTDSTFIVRLQQADRKPVISGFELFGKSSSDSLTLQWYMDFQLSWYPWEKFSTLFYEQTYGAMMEKGLKNIKQQMTP